MTIGGLLFYAFNHFMTFQYNSVVFEKYVVKHHLTRGDRLAEQVDVMDWSDKLDPGGVHIMN